MASEIVGARPSTPSIPSSPTARLQRGWHG